MLLDQLEGIRSPIVVEAVDPQMSVNRSAVA